MSVVPVLGGWDEGSLGLGNDQCGSQWMRVKTEVWKKLDGKIAGHADLAVWSGLDLGRA